MNLNMCCNTTAATLNLGIHLLLANASKLAINLWILNKSLKFSKHWVGGGGGTKQFMKGGVGHNYNGTFWSGVTNQKVL